MARNILLTLILGLLAAPAARAAELRLAWQGADAAVREIELNVGDQAVIEVYVDNLATDDDLSTVFFSNEFVPEIVQVAGTAVPAGWVDGTTEDSTLGEGGQQAAFAATAGSNLDGPGDALVGIVTIQLVDGAAGQTLEIAFDADFTDVLNGAGGSYTLRASGDPAADNAGAFHLGAGSPGYTTFGQSDVRDPLIVRIPADGGGGGGNTNDNDNQNVNDNTNDNQNVNDNANDNTNDNQNTNDNTNDNANDNANDNDNVNGNDNVNTNVNDNVNGNTNNNTNDNGSAPGGGPCGVGTISLMPVALLGLLMLQVQRQRRR